jgi:hypothetical protein
MEILDHIQMATSALLSNKLRSSLTMLGITIGNASVIGMVAVGEGARELTAEQFKALDGRWGLNEVLHRNAQKGGSLRGDGRCWRF